MADQQTTKTALFRRNLALLDIFTEEQIHCKNLTQMGTSIGRCMELLSSDLNQNALMPIQQTTPAIIGVLERCLKGKGTLSKEMLVADMDALTDDIKRKLRDGVFEIAQSKQVNGNLAPTIRDAKSKKVVKWLTLKQLKMEGQPVHDLNTLAVQVALKNISEQLQVIDVGIQYLIQFARRDSLQTPYFDAMHKILDARRAVNEKQCMDDVQKAIDFLEHGLSGLYGDLHDCVSKLNGIKLPILTQRTINYICEDMIFIPQYVSLLAYLFNFTGRNESAQYYLEYYQTEISDFTTKPVVQGQLPAALLVHDNCKYTADNMDFWLDGMAKVNRELSSLPVYTNDTKNLYIYLRWGMMKMGIFDRLKDRSRCLKCQKKLVGNQKWFCAKCKQDIESAGALACFAIVAILLDAMLDKKEEE